MLILSNAFEFNNRLFTGINDFAKPTYDKINVSSTLLTNENRPSLSLIVPLPLLLLIM